MDIFKKIHEIVFHSKGAYSWDIVYNMPIWLRDYTFNELKKYYDTINKQTEQKSNIPPQNKINKPNIGTYSAKK